MRYEAAFGHETLHHRFATAIENGKLHHAWLLHGVKGVGKATEAVAMAALYLCERGGEVACGECHGCRMLAAGSHPDFFSVERLEKKRDITVEQIRETLSFLSLSGMESEKRVVLIDDAETMNVQAANALLKGLEEPSPGSLLLIVCHDLMRLPATVRSRCMLGECSPLDKPELEKVLKIMDFSDKAGSLAIEIAAGRPGHVACFQEKSVVDGLLAWRKLLSGVDRADVGQIQSWIDKHLSLIPHELIVDVVLEEAKAHVERIESFAQRESLLSTMMSVAAWPREVVRHSLRAGPALMALLLELRAALKTS